HASVANRRLIAPGIGGIDAAAPEKPAADVADQFRHDLAPVIVTEDVVSGTGPGNGGVDLLEGLVACVSSQVVATLRRDTRRLRVPVEVVDQLPVAPFFSSRIIRIPDAVQSPFEAVGLPSPLPVVEPDDKDHRKPRHLYA